MKKIFSMLLVLALVFGLGTAYAESLTVWCWDQAFNIYAMKEAEKIYQKDHPDFSLNIIETPWADVQTKLIAAASSDLSTLPDILLMQDMAFQKNLITYPSAFAEVSTEGLDLSKFSPSKVNYSTLDGKNYGVPFDNGTAIAAWRTDILEKAGYKLSDLNDITWDRFIEIGKDVLEKTGVPMLSFEAGANDQMMMGLQSMGASLFTEDGKINIANNDKLKLCIKLYQDLVNNKLLKSVANWDEYVKDLQNGGCVGTYNGCWIIGSITAGESLEGKWGITNIPKFDVENATNYASNGGSTWVVTGGAKNPDLAKDFLAKTFGSSKELYDTILEKAGAIATYLPAAESQVYSRPQKFFGDQAIYADIMKYAEKVPSVPGNVYHYEARDAVAVAIQNIVSGMDVDTALQNAQAEVDALVE